MNQYNIKYRNFIKNLNEGLMDFDELDQAINKLKVSADKHNIPLHSIAGNTFELFGVEIQVKGFAKLGESDNQQEFDFDRAKRDCKSKGSDWFWCTKDNKCKQKDPGGVPHGGINENS